jgi:hypothetical protein
VSKCAAEVSALVIPEMVVLKTGPRWADTDVFVPHCCRDATVSNSLGSSVVYQFQLLLSAMIYQKAKVGILWPVLTNPHYDE